MADPTDCQPLDQIERDPTVSIPVESDSYAPFSAHDTPSWSVETVPFDFREPIASGLGAHEEDFALTGFVADDVVAGITGVGEA